MAIGLYAQCVDKMYKSICVYKYINVCKCSYYCVFEIDKLAQNAEKSSIERGCIVEMHGLSRLQWSGRRWRADGRRCIDSVG